MALIFYWLFIGKYWLIGLIDYNGQTHNFYQQKTYRYKSAKSFGADIQCEALRVQLVCASDRQEFVVKVDDKVGICRCYSLKLMCENCLEDLFIKFIIFYVLMYLCRLSPFILYRYNVANFGNLKIKVIVSE